jgi:protein-S-isoprenylcysteine O-methyltransferase Ste14
MNDLAPASEHNAKPDTMGHVLPPPLLFIAGIVVGLLLHRALPVPLLPRGVAWAAGPALIVLGGFIGIVSLGVFFRARTSPFFVRPTTALVIAGPFRFSRNPMYLGLSVGYLGIALWMNGLWPLLLLPVVLVVLQVAVIAREERFMERRFGEEYRRYKARVRRWL